jgi:hypothetical protein
MTDPSIESDLGKLKPIAVAISTDDVQALFACGTDPNQYSQLILAKLKDAGAPVEGVFKLKLAHGKVCKLKDSIHEAQSEFTYVWLPEEYVYAIQNGGGLA